MNTTNTHRNREAQASAMIVGGADDNGGDVHTMRGHVRKDTEGRECMRMGR